MADAVRANYSSMGLARSPIAGTPAVSTVATAGGKPGIFLREQVAGTVLQIIARRGKADAVRAALHSSTGLEAPAKPRRVAKDNAALVWSGPAQWLLMTNGGADIAAAAVTALTGLASLSDQSDSRLHLELYGPRTRDAMAKLVGIDVHPATFPEGAAAMTAIADIPVHLWRLPDAAEGAAFVIAGPQSTSASLWHHVVVAAEEYGLDAQPAHSGLPKYPSRNRS